MKRLTFLFAALSLGLTSPAGAVTWTAAPVSAGADQGGIVAVQWDRDRRGFGDDRKDNRKDERKDSRRDDSRREEPRRDESRREDPRREDPRREEGRGYDRPQVSATPRVSPQQAYASIARSAPGQQLDTRPVIRNGRAYWEVRWQTRDGRRVDYLVDGDNGAIVSSSGG